MSHFAQLDSNNTVISVLVIEQDVIDTGLFGEPTSFIQTSYNTYSGTHQLGGTPLRKNYAGIGFTYDSTRDAFIPPKLYTSWTLNEDTCQWQSPVPYPEDKKRYIWNEGNQTWDLFDNN